MNPYTSIYKLCINKLKENNIDANIIRTARTESIIGSVAINEGISLLPKSNFEVFHQKKYQYNFAKATNCTVCSSCKTQKNLHQI